MKRTKIIIASLLCLIILTSCTSVQKDGIVNFDKYTCSVGLTTNLFPSDDFLSRFQAAESDYHYWDEGDWMWGYVKVFAYLQYDLTTYLQAKEYCFATFSLSGGERIRYSEYEFIETIQHTHLDTSENRISYSEFPYRFNMFGYNDERHTLFFLGYYNGNSKAKELHLAKNNFGAFLKTVYGQYYTWESEKA